MPESPSSTYESNNHQPAPSSVDHSLLAPKRAYLALLPPPQVVEICLTFEAYAPPHIKAVIWPTDLNAAIAALQGQRVPDKGADPPMDSLDANQQSPDGSTTVPQSSTSDPSKVTIPLLPPSQPQPPYPHQPYGYSHAYPHAPYHPPPYGYGSASQPPHLQYPYPHPHAPTNPPYLPAPYPHPLVPPDGSNDDLPSYEEMIVEALKDFDDPEGSQPRRVFSWMASHYPLQTNFRPSASQALQKAYKRGRLEKSSGGKYRLNAAWEGGNTSRRTTRRPQTHTQTALAIHNPQVGQAPPIASPFTHAPLHRSPPLISASTYAYRPPGPPLPPVQDGKEGDAWEAAQNILNAINFGGMMNIPNEDKTPEPKKQAIVVAVDPSLDGSPDGRAALQAQLAVLAVQLAEIGQVADDIMECEGNDIDNGDVITV